MGLSPAAGEQLRRTALDEFTRKTGVEVDLIPTSGTSAEQVAIMRDLLHRHSRAPDLYLIDTIWRGALQDDLLDLSPYLKKPIRDPLFERLQNTPAAGGRIFCLPVQLNVGMLYYRADLLPRYGFGHPPRTWAELATMARTIQRGERARGRRDFWGYVWQGSAYEGLTCNALEWQASFGGGHIIEPDGTISVNNAATVAAFRNAAGWIGTISPRSVLSYTEADSLNAFRSGHAAFLRYWSSGFGHRRAIDPAASRQFSVTSLPSGPAGIAQVMGGFHLAVSRYSAHPDEAAQLAAYLASPAVQLRRALAGGYLPSISSLYRNSDLQAAAPQAAILNRTGLDSWVARPSVAARGNYGEVSRAYYETVHNIVSGEADPSQSVAALADQLAAITGARATAKAR